MGRIALKFGYNGNAFYGYQRQPEVRTVEGDIISACLKMKAFDDPAEADFSSASRTDRGVHAIGNVAAFNTDFNPVELVEGLNATCRDILFHSYLSVNASFAPRRAKMRHYRYLLFEEVDGSALGSALDLFVGRKDFKNFSKSGARGRYRTVESIHSARKDGCFVIDFRGTSFLHNMLRRITAAAVSVAKGAATIGEIETALQGNASRSFGLAPPEYLVLMDVDYGMKFTEVRKREETLSRWNSEIHRLRALEYVESALVEKGR